MTSIIYPRSCRAPLGSCLLKAGGLAADLVRAQGASAGPLQGLIELRRVSQLRQTLQLPKQPVQLLKCNLQSTTKLSTLVHLCWQHSMASEDVSIRYKGTSMN